MHDLISYGENVAAIAATLHGEQYDAIYAQCSEKMGGFVGIWNLCAIAGRAFSDKEEPYTAGEDFYWIEAIDEYAASVSDFLLSGEIPCQSTLHKLAADSIENNQVSGPE